MNIIAISGSLRAESYNTNLLNAAGQFLQEHEFKLLSCDLPLYNEELEGDATPLSVQGFKSAITQADLLLMATPEYNHSFSGVLKNAIDWASRPAFNSPLKNKPIALLSASMSPLGGAQGQAHLRTVLASTLSQVYTDMEYLLGSAHTAFNSKGQLEGENELRKLERFMTDYLNWAK